MNRVDEINICASTAEIFRRTIVHVHNHSCIIENQKLITAFQDSKPTKKNSYKLQIVKITTRSILDIMYKAILVLT
jgi:hypothetical protein